MKGRKKWTDAQKAYLRQHYYTQDTATIATAVEKSPDAVRLMAQRMMLNKRKQSLQQRREAIRPLMDHMTTTQIAEHLDMNVNTVRSCIWYMTHDQVPQLASDNFGGLF